MVQNVSGLIVDIFKEHVDIADRRQARKGTGHYVRTRLAAVVFQAKNFLDSPLYPKNLKANAEPRLLEIINYCHELLADDAEYERIALQNSGRFVNRRDQLASEIQESIDDLKIDGLIHHSESVTTEEDPRATQETFSADAATDPDEFKKVDDKEPASASALDLEIEAASATSWALPDFDIDLYDDFEVTEAVLAETIKTNTMSQSGEGIEFNEFESPGSGLDELLLPLAKHFELEEKKELCFSPPDLPNNFVRGTYENDDIDGPISSHWSLFERNIEFALEYRDFIRTIPLLRTEEEAALAQRIEAGLFAEQELIRSKDIPKTLERELRWVARDGQRAKSRMVGANLRLVFQIASKQPYFGLDLMDLVQEGNIGLLRAVEKFDYKLGNKFSTYATWWIRQAISRSTADQGRLIRLPVHVMDSIKKLRNYRRSHLQANNVLSTYEADSVHLNVSVEKIQELDRIFTNTISLDSEIGQTSTRLLDLLVDDTQQSVEEAVADVFLCKQLEYLLDSLSERQAGILRMRHGLGDNIPKTLDVIGDTFGVTRERIRQLEKQSMEMLRGADWIEPLRDYLDVDTPLVWLRTLAPLQSKQPDHGKIYPVSISVKNKSSKSISTPTHTSVYVPSPKTINDFIAKHEEAIENGNWEFAENLEATIWEMSQDQTN